MSNEAKFTKGEWKIFNERVGVVDNSDTQSFGMMMEVAYIDMYNFGQDEGKANSHLIAATPEMYGEIERDINELIKLLQNLDRYSNDYLFYSSELERKQQLLAKARGE